MIEDSQKHVLYESQLTFPYMKKHVSD